MWDIDGYHYSHIFTFLRKLFIDFHSDCTNLHFQPQWISCSLFPVFVLLNFAILTMEHLKKVQHLYAAAKFKSKLL